jgi:alpha-D-ribose 1-methylphosphonate 5-triphosphate synthase subunit PhnH
MTHRAPHDLAALPAGFLDPARESQALFRAIMQAIARPGTLADLSAAPTPPADLDHAAGAVALTLVDGDAPVWLAPRLREGLVSAWISFHCGAPVIEAPAHAAFAFADASSAPPLAAFAQGEARYPDRSTTLVLSVDALGGGPAIELSGPGIETVRPIAPSGLPDDFWSQWAANGAHFPLGVDLMLVAGAHLIGLPRTTRARIIGG